MLRTIIPSRNIVSHVTSLAQPISGLTAARTILALALALGALLIIGSLVDWSEVGSATEALRSRPWLLGALLATYTGAVWLRAVAWKCLLTHRTGIFHLFGALQGSLLVNHLLPFKAGEAARIFLIARRGVPLAEATATTAVARLLDLAVLTAIAAGLGAFVVSDARGLGTQTLILPAVLLAGVGAALVLVRSRRASRFLPRPVSAWIEVFRTQLKQMSASQVGIAALWTIPSWVLEAAVVLVAAEAIGIELSLTQAIAVTAFTIVAQVFHVTPGNVGVYEATMTGALYALGIPPDQGLALSVLTHGLKFAYSYTIAAAFTLTVMRVPLRFRGLGFIRGTANGEKGASRFEIVAARLWNVFNEGKPFTPVFVLGILLLLSLPHVGDPAYWMRAGVAVLALVPLFVVFYRFDFPLRLRVALWAYLALFLVLFRFFDVGAVALILGLYLAFTVVLWGTVYYRLRIGTSWLNFTRFWRLVLENPDPTSGNFLEQVPKLALLVLAFEMLVERPGIGTVATFELFVLSVGTTAVLIHQWFFTWVPTPPLASTRLRATASGRRLSRRLIAIVIDGCRADRLLEADTPFIDRIRREGADYVNAATVYPARTVTAFSSMLTGATPRAHGMSSNFVPSLGVKCESIFDTLRASGMTGKLVGIAHLVDAFGEQDVETVTAVTDNDEIDEALAARARAVLERDAPDLLVLQLLSVDQTGHARGSYNDEYLAKIEATDRIIARFFEWCERNGYMDDATFVITSDHGQGIGIGGHGHMSPSEVYVPCILWGKGVERAGPIEEPRSIMDIAPTIAYYLGAQPPQASVGQVLGVMEDSDSSKPLAVIVPAYNEVENLPETLRQMPRGEIADMRVIVVDDGSTDGTAEVARLGGADVVARHERNRGLGAALRTGLEAAREMDARAAVYIDADGEYPPSQIPDLLAPIEAGDADYVLGSRYLGSRDGQTFTRLVANYMFTALLCVASGRVITDGQTGFRAFSRRALERVEIIHDYNYAQVMTLDLLKKGMRMREVPISYRRRTRGSSFIGPSYLWRVPIAMVREMLSA